MKKNHNSFFILVVFLLFCVVGSDLFASNEVIPEQETYVFHTALQSPIKEILDARIQEAFRRLNLTAKVLISSSSQRALILANEDGDGDAARVADIKEIASEDTINLVKVPAAIVTLVLAVYTKDLSFPVEGWHSLEEYHNGARIGAKILEKNIPEKRTFLPTTEQLVQLLDSGRIDTMIEWNLIARDTIRNLNVTSIKELTPPLTEKLLYIYLHKKHQALVPQLDKILLQMKEDGSFESISKEFVFYTGVQAPRNVILEKRLHEAFKRIGLKFKLVTPGSSQRALVLANEDGDGDASRIAGVKQIAPENTKNLIQISESIDTVKMFVYTKGAVASVDGYESLAHLQNGFRVGVKLLEKNIPGERIMLPDSPRLFQMLYDGRLDTVVEWPSIADKIIKENSYSGITKLPKPLIDMPLYPFIHKKHRALIPAIEKALKEMKKDGTFTEIIEDTQ